MDFKKYRQKAREYQKCKCIINNNIKILKEDGIIVEQWGEKSGKLEIKKSMTLKEMKEVEKKFNVHFVLGGNKFTNFEFNEEVNNDCHILMKEIRQAQQKTSDLYNGYFKDILYSVYQDAKICDEVHKIELGTKFWGFLIRPKLFDRVLTTDELMAIEKETDSTFINYDVTFGYHFNFNYEE